MEKIQLNYHKRKVVDLGNLIDTTTNEPYLLDDLQLYNPLYSKFFNLNEKNYNTVTLNNKYHIKGLNEVYETRTVNNVHSCVDISKNIFVKFSPLLDTMKFLTGKYDTNDLNLMTLPSISSTNETCHKKMLCLNNASYVDNFFYYLSSVLLNDYKFVHGMDYYGSFLGIQSNFKVNVSDDLEYLSSTDFFINNIGVLFTADELKIHCGEQENTKTKRPELDIGDDIDGDVDDDIFIADLPNLNIHSDDANNEDTKPTEIIELNDLEIDDEIQDNISDSSDSDNSEINYSDDDSEDGDKDCEYSVDVEEANTEETDSEYSDSEFDNIFVKIKKFPTQMICLEKCEDTLDHLLEGTNDDKTIAAYLCQIVMTLITYQNVFNFTHNDLHTNNIMYINTDRKFLWYKYKNVYYKVPTYGKILKLIDFGRSIFNFNGEVFCSDSFFEGGDGETQYNCEPFYDNTKKRIDPNFSFDLCRLGCSLYDFVFQPDTDHSKLTPLQTTVKRWVTDDNNYNVLYKKNGDERYKGFKLYKMISRIVTAHTPEKQLDFQFFSQFRQKKQKNTNLQLEDVMDIDKLTVTYKRGVKT